MDGTGKVDNDVLIKTFYKYILTKTISETPQKLHKKKSKNTIVNRATEKKKKKKQTEEEAKEEEE